MNDFQTNLRSLSREINGMRSVTHELGSQVRKLHEAARRTGTGRRDCQGPQCNNLQPHSHPGFSASAAFTGTQAAKLTSGLTKSIGSTLNQVVNRLVSTLTNTLSRTLQKSVASGIGGGLGGSLLSGLVGGGIGALVNGLISRRRAVKVENVVQAEILNFPSLTNLAYSINPASRLFGDRAVARGPSFNVNIEYKQGADELVTARVAKQLSDLNSMQGVV